MFKRFAILALTSALVPAVSRADFYLHGWETHAQSPGALRLEPGFSYYMSSSNYDTNGATVTPTGLDSYTRIQGDIDGAYGLNRFLTAFARVSWARVQLNHATAPGETFGLTDQTLGMTASVWESKSPALGIGTLRVDLQLQGDLPAYVNGAVTSGVPYLGDGTTDLTGGGFLTLDLSQSKTHRWALSGGGGFTWRSNSFSTAIPWSFGVRLDQEEQGLVLRAAVYGTQSLKSDVSTATANQGAGGSAIVNAVNPSLISVRGEIGYQLAGNLGIVATGSQSLIGLDAPVGLSFGLGLRAVWGGNLIPKNPMKQSPQEYGRSNQGFVNYSFEGRVLRSNDKLNLIKIDKGSQDGVEVGQIFDIFLVKKDGSVGEAVARAKCASVKLGEAALSVSEFYKEVWIEEGFVVKRPLQ